MCWSIDKNVNSGSPETNPIFLLGAIVQYLLIQSSWQLYRIYIPQITADNENKLYVIVFNPRITLLFSFHKWELWSTEMWNTCWNCDLNWGSSRSSVWALPTILCCIPLMALLILNLYLCLLSLLTLYMLCLIPLFWMSVVCATSLFFL